MGPEWAPRSVPLNLLQQKMQTALTSAFLLIGAEMALLSVREKQKVHRAQEALTQDSVQQATRVASVTLARIQEM